MGVICLIGSGPILPNTTRCSMLSRRALVICSQAFAPLGLTSSTRPMPSVSL